MTLIGNLFGEAYSTTTTTTVTTTTDQSTPSTIGISFLRHFFDFIDWFLFIGLVVAASNPEHKRIADNIASTRVVNKA